VLASVWNLDEGGSRKSVVPVQDPGKVIDHAVMRPEVARRLPYLACAGGMLALRWKTLPGS
jgi:hypothetical protein